MPALASLNAALAQPQESPVEIEKSSTPPFHVVPAGSAPVPSPSESLDETAATLRRIEHQIADVFFDLVERRRGVTGIAGETPARSTVELRLELPSPAAPAASRALDGQLLEQLSRAAERLADRTAAFPSGRVYCYWCRSFECQHARCADPRSVFYGYSATGQPLWSELSSLLLERHDPRVDFLYREPPIPVTVVQSGNELAGDQLQVYGRGSGVYRILGQLVVGYLDAGAGHPAPRGTDSVRHRRARSHYALTLQAVQAGDGASGVLLNVVGTLPDGTPALEAIDEAADARLADLLVKARRRLSEVALESVPRRRRGRERRRRALEILHGLARNLERVFRQKARRTFHSEDRRRDKARPASRAFEDALAAKDERVFRDVEERTWVIVGPKNRVHVFNDAGLHITSVVYPGETVRHRTTKGKWLQPRAEELAAFRTALEETARGADDDGGD
jgi:hypothetical protein